MAEMGHKDVCLFHDNEWRDLFQQTLKVLKGKVIPKNITKRTGYLVCNCSKKHTELDDVAKRLNLRKLKVRLMDELIKAQNKSQLNPDKDSVACTTESTDDNIDESTENQDLTDKMSPLEVDSCKLVSENSDSGVHDNNILPPLLLDCFDRSEIGSGQNRLLAIIHLCMSGENEILEPRSLHKEKVMESRKLKRGKYFRHLKPSEKVKKVKYDVVRNIIFEKPSIKISGFVGKQGKNVKKIMDGTDAKVEIKSGKVIGNIEIFVRAKSTADYGVIHQRVDQMYKSLNYAYSEWQRKKQAREETRVQLIKDMEGNTRRVQKCQWDIDEEIKASARDKYTKKSSYQLSRSPPDHSKPKMLEQGSRCLNCMAPYDSSATSSSDCKYHPGFIDQGSKWTCCAMEIGLDDRSRHQSLQKKQEAQKESHQINGCTTGPHNWRPHKSVKCSSRKHREQQAF